MGTIMVLIGGLMMLVGGIMLLVAAFQQSVLWGLGCLFVPFVSLIFVIMFWNDAKNAFLIQIAGIGVYVVGAFVIGAGGAPAVL